ncbi:MAG: cytochrome P450, partial [Janthinobacterium lividum]
GTGVHHCIGKRLAHHVLRTALQEMLTRFPALRLADANFRPVYHGLTGELSPTAMPMRTH